MRRTLIVGLIAICAIVAVPGAASAAKPAAAAATQITVNGTVVEVAGPAVGGATVVVQLLDKGTYVTQATLTTGPGGTWTFGGKRGTYRFAFSASGADPVTVDATYTANGTYTLTTQLQCYGAISGIVRDSSTALPIGGATVDFFAALPGGGWATTPSATVSAPGGTYTSPQLPTGSYAVRASAAGYIAAYLGGATPTAVAVTRAQTTAAGDLSLVAQPQTGTISGRVVVGSAQTPVVGWYIWLYKQNADGTWPPTTSATGGWGSPTKTVYGDAAGNYTSGDIPLGNWKVRFYAPHFASQWWMYLNNVDATTADYATVVTLSEPGQAITGIDGWFNKP